MKRIISVIGGSFLLVFLIFSQLQAMEHKGKAIYVYIAQDALTSLGLTESDRGPYMIRLGINTTARDVLEEVALPTTSLYMPSYVPQSEFHPLGERLADAYNQGLLSLWAVYKEGETLQRSPLTPKRKIGSKNLMRDFLFDYGDTFVIRYSK